MSKTIAEAWAQFTDERSVALSPSTIDTDYKIVQKWLDRCPVQEPERGREVMTWVLKQEPKHSAIKVARFVKTFYGWATSQGVELVATNPVESFKFPKEAQATEVVVISKAELPIVLEALRPRPKTRAKWHELAQFMLQTGMRTGEARAVRLQDIKDDRVLVHCNYTVRHGLKNSTKTNKQRIVPLNSIALEVLARSKPDSDGYVFPWNRVAFMSYFAARMDELVQQGKIGSRYRPYDLRHTCISLWLEAGIPVAQAAAWAGNSAEVIWSHYCNVTDTYAMPVL